MGDQNDHTNSSVMQAHETFVAMPLLQQSGNVFVGPGALKEAQTIGLGLSKLTRDQRYDLDRAKRYAMDQSIKFVLLKQQIAHQQNQQKLSMYSQALSLMARIYIGSISFEIREEQIKQNFSVFGPIKSINMSWDTVTGHHKGFAFLEFEVPEAALLALDAMNGKFIGGRNLKVLPVGRPANMPQAQPIIEMVMQEAKDYNRLYVASVHPDLTEQDLRLVFGEFGEITKCQLAKQPGRAHRGFGYLEFKTPQAVKEAIEGMNNFDLGGQYLQVGRCITPPDALTYVMPSTQSSLPTASAVAAAAVTARIQAAEITAPRTNRASVSAQLAITNSAASSNSPSQPSPPPSQPQQKASTSRRRGFGGYAPIAAAPAIVQPLAVANFAHNSPQGGPIPVKVVPFGQQPPPPPPPPPKEELPPLPVQAPAASFWSQPHSLPPTTNGSTTSNNNNGSSSSFSIKQEPIDNIPPPPPQKSPVKPKKEKKDILSRIKIKEPYPDPNQMATFAPLPNIIAPKDPLAIKNEGENGGEYLAITSGSGQSSTALVLREDKSSMVKVENEAKKSSGGKSDGFHHKRKKKSKQSKSHGPKLNTPQALAAAEKVGAINDKMQAANSQNEEATLASQEHVEIRGNDARHLLMHKLMRTNRSSVIVLKNMITSEDQLDEELDDEIRGECQKYGVVLDLVIVQESQGSDDIRIFVKFADPTQAEAARLAMDGRFFDARKVSALPYDQILFEHKDFTG